MNRWIDADEVEKLMKCGCAYAIWKLPSIDLVCCGECKYCEEYESMEGMEYICSRVWCSPYDWADKPCFYVSPDSFCSYGERKESE